MSDKKKQILEAAVKCFAEKGFQGTSIQDIADQLDMAKGSLYFYFKSKEDLLVHIFKQHFERFVKDIRFLAADPGLHPREKLRRYVLLSFEQNEEYRDFITLFFHEKFEMNAEIHGYMLALRKETLLTMHGGIVGLYGEEAHRYAVDAASMFNSLVNTYLFHSLFDRIPMYGEETADFLLARLDDMMKGMMERDARPLLDADDMLRRLEGMNGCGFHPHQEALNELDRLSAFIEPLELDPADREEIEEAAAMLRAEWSKPRPSVTVIKGMLALLKAKPNKELKKMAGRLEDHLPQS